MESARCSAFQPFIYLFVFFCPKAKWNFCVSLSPTLFGEAGAGWLVHPSAGLPAREGRPGRFHSSKKASPFSTRLPLTSGVFRLPPPCPAVSEPRSFPMLRCPGMKALEFARTRLSCHLKLCSQNPSLHHALLLSSLISQLLSALLFDPSDLCGTQNECIALLQIIGPKGWTVMEQREEMGFFPLRKFNLD